MEKRMKAVAANISYVYDPGVIGDAVTSSRETNSYLRELYNDEAAIREEFWAVYLNRANNVIGQKQISIGSIAGTMVEVRIIIKAALDVLASGIILSHNHPSGNMRPSGADLKVTEKITEAAKLFDIKVLDHVIINPHDSGSYYSFADEGKI